MAWPKIKNIIILILLGTNLCLLVFAASRGLSDRRQQEQARANAISFLQQQGIELDEETEAGVFYGTLTADEDPQIQAAITALS